jgi:hypothetical protein
MVLQLNRSITQKIWKKNIPCRILLFFLMNNRRRQVSLDPSFLSIVCVFAIVVLLITLFINVNILYLNKMHLLNELFYGRCMLERVVIDYLMDFVFRFISRYFHNHHDLYYVYFSDNRLNIKCGKYHTVTFSATYIFIFINFQMKITSEIREIHYYHPFQHTTSVEEFIQEMHLIQV